MRLSPAVSCPARAPDAAARAVRLVAGRALAVAREPNNRIQILAPDGTFIEEWKGRPTPCGIFIDAEGIVYLAEGGGVSVLTLEGRLLTQWVVVAIGEPFGIEELVGLVFVLRRGVAAPLGALARGVGPGPGNGPIYALEACTIFG